MKLNKLLGILLIITFTLSVVAPFALADELIYMDSLWMDNSESLTVNEGDVAELFTQVTSVYNFQLSIALVQGVEVTELVDLSLPKAPEDPYYDQHIIDTTGLSGTYDVVIEAINKEQAVEASLTLTVLAKENNAPGFSFDPEWDYTEGNDWFQSLIWEREVGNFFNVNILGTDADNDDLTITLQENPAITLPPGVNFVDNGDNTASVSGTPTATGDYGLLFTVSDGDKSVQYAMKFRFVEPTPLTLQELPNQEVFEEDSLTFTIDAEGGKEQIVYEVKKTSGCSSSNPFCELLEFFAELQNPTPGNANFDETTGVYTISPDYDFVQHPDLTDLTKLKFRAHSGEETTPWERVDLTVKDLNRKPEITSESVPASLDVNEVKDFLAHAVDADGDTLEYSWNFGDGTGLQLGSLLPHSFQTAGTYTVTVNVKDNFGGFVSKNFTVTVSDIEPVLGCTDPIAENFNPDATEDDGSCEYILGCTDPEAENYNENATKDDGSCQCKDENANGICDNSEVLGCTDPIAENFNPDANVDDGSCDYIYGCTDKNAVNYNPNATKDDNSCVAEVLGCTEPAANNYNPLANVDDGSCKFGIISTPKNFADVGVEYEYQVLVLAPQPEDRQYLLGNVQYELLQGPAGMTISDTGLVEFLPTQKGVFTVTIKAFRGQLEALQTYTLYVLDNAKESIRISSVFVNPEDVYAGEQVAIHVSLENNGGKDLEDLRVKGTIYDLGWQVESGKFDLDRGEQEGVVLYTYVPYDTYPGEYLVTVSVGNNDLTKESYWFFNVK